MPIPFVGQVASSVRKRFSDVFSSRSNTTGSLGRATDGSAWDATSGTIQITSGAAKATTLPSTAGNSYPMATVVMPTGNNTIKLKDVGQGTAAAIWVQSSADWWMVGIDSEYNTIPGNTSYAYSQNAYVQSQGVNSSTQFSFTNYAGPALGTNYQAFEGFVNKSATNAYNVSYKSSVSYSGPTFTFGPPVYKSSVNYTATYGGGNTYWFNSPTSNYQAYNYYYYYPSGTGYAWSPGSYFWFTTGGEYFTFSFTNATTYAFSQILRVRQSVGGTVSTITSSVISAAQTAASLLVSIVGNQITAKAYSDNNFVTQLGSDLVYTATGATVNTRYGIAVSPSAYQQSDIIATSVEITRN